MRRRQVINMEPVVKCVRKCSAFNITIRNADSPNILEKAVTNEGLVLKLVFAHINSVSLYAKISCVTLSEKSKKELLFLNNVPDDVK